MLPSPLPTMSAEYNITDKLPMPKCPAQIPRLGFGVYESSQGQCVASCMTALKVGYRHIDTAQVYGNEVEVGTAVRQSGLERSDVFITTKILSAGGSFAKSLQKCLESVKKIDGEEGYVDCFLIHSPGGGKETRKEMWQALEKLYEMGQAKSIGVSNFGVRHIKEMKAYAKVWPPHVNQIEVCVLLYNPPGGSKVMFCKV
jgi:diketogulonate reductase-like aldo/keto reductase